MSEQKQELGADAISGAVRSLLERPELLSSVASALGVDLGGKLGKADGDDVTDDARIKDSALPAQQAGDTVATLAPIISRLSAGGGQFRHEALLCALKPYVSPTRADAIDHILKFAKMSSLVKGLK